MLYGKFYNTDSMNSQIKNINSDLPSLFSRNTRWNSFVSTMNLQPWRIFYFGLVPKKIRKKVALKADIELQKQMAKASKNFLNLYLNGSLKKFNLKAKKTLNTNKIIWQYWGQGVDDKTLPETVKICFNSVDKYKKDYQIIRLDDTTIHEYLDLPEFIFEKRLNKEFKHVFFSDLLRLALLDTYGGIWMDATILLTNPIPENVANMNFFVFQRDENALDKAYFETYDPLYFGWHNSHYVNILSSFMVGKRKNEVIHTWLDLLLNFWETQTSIKHYFFFQIIFHELIHHKDFEKKNCTVKDDTLVHLLQTKMHEIYDAEEFAQIQQRTSIHKLRYVKNTVPGSYYDHVKKIYL